MRQKPFTLSTLVLLVLLAGCSSAAQPTPAATQPASSTAAPSGASAALPNFGHIFVIVMENKEYGDVIGNSAAPYINSLARQYGLAANYFAVTHPSLPNYLELLGGSTFGISSDCTDCFVNATNLVDQLETAHKSWKAYMEDMPAPCSLGSTGEYAMKHNPFAYFDDIRQNQARCNQIVPLTALSHDLAGNALPDFVWITPNLCHDMHDCSVGTGDTWLHGFLPQILNSSAWKSQGVIFVVWDEGSSNAGCCQIAQGGHVPLLVISPLGKSGFTSSASYDHASLLLTIEDAWHLGTLRDSGCPCTAPLADFFM